MARDRAVGVSAAQPLQTQGLTPRTVSLKKLSDLSVIFEWNCRSIWLWLMYAPQLTFQLSLDLDFPK